MNVPLFLTIDFTRLTLSGRCVGVMATPWTSLRGTLARVSSTALPGVWRGGAFHDSCLWAGVWRSRACNVRDGR